MGYFYDWSFGLSRGTSLDQECIDQRRLQLYFGNKNYKGGKQLSSFDENTYFFTFRDYGIGKMAFNLYFGDKHLLTSIGENSFDAFSKAIVDMYHKYPDWLDLMDEKKKDILLTSLKSLKLICKYRRLFNQQ